MLFLSKFLENRIMKEFGALFDLDGVLIDSERLYTQFYNRLGAEYGLEEDFALKIKGSTIEKILSTYFPAPEDSAAALKQLNEFEANMEYPICEGVIELLEELRASGIPAVIVTSSSENKMERLYSQHPHLSDYFEAIITGSDVKRSKPDPEGYLLAAARINRRPEDCFVFEDSLSGLQAGIASGAVVVGLTTTLPEERLKGKAHLLIDSLAGFGVKNMLELHEKCVNKL